MEVKKEEEHVDPKVAFLLQRCNDLEKANEQLQAKIKEHKCKVWDEVSQQETAMKMAVSAICEDVNDYMSMVETFQVEIGATPLDVTSNSDDEYNLDILSIRVEEISNMTPVAKKGLSEVTKDWEGVQESVKDVMEATAKMIIHKITGNVGPSNPQPFDFRI